MGRRMASPDTTKILEGHTDWVRGVGWGEIDSQPRLATASDDRTVRVWDPVSGDTTKILKGHTNGVRGVAWGEIDGQPRLATASFDETVRVWDPATNDCLIVVPASGAFAVDLSGTALAVGLARGLFVIDLS
ncbi:MAG: hypothetical protein GY926_26070 [bacterium]|nr:hypothetical protein [bacterium]